MHQTLKKISKAPWVFNQLLTRIPSSENTMTSDLFIWRNDNALETYFELLDIPSFITENNIKKRKVDIIFFDHLGNELFRKFINVSPHKRHLVNISDIVKKELTDTKNNYGTFCVFHYFTPICVTHFNSFLTERGYVSYNYENSPVRTYVHGNFDAVANDKNISPMSASSFLFRDYYLQYLFEDKVDYEIAIVNPSNKPKKISIRFIDSDNKIIKKSSVKLEQRASHIEYIRLIKPCRVSIRSKLIMARPQVFSYKGNRINVFHG